MKKLITFIAKFFGINRHRIQTRATCTHFKLANTPLDKWDLTSDYHISGDCISFDQEQPKVIVTYNK